MTEFARILGLLPVVMHRNDLIGAVSGAGVLRQQLITLMQYDQLEKPARGALNQTAMLTPEGANAVLQLPAVSAEYNSILRFHQACWNAFLEHGPRISDRYQARWPTRLLDAVHARFTREFDVGFALPR